MTDSASALPPAPTGTVSIGLISDTHGWLDPAIHAHFAGVAHIVHGGDVGDDAVLHELGTIAPVMAVRGNIDYGVLADLPWTAVLKVAGKRIAALHIAGSPTKPNRDAQDLAARERPDVLVVGHSHIAIAGRVLGTLWINPGAAGHHGFHAVRTAAVLRIAADGSLALYEITLGPRGTKH